MLGILLADVRISVETPHGMVPLQTVGLRKLRVFSAVTVAGFAGDVVRAWAALDTLGQYLRVHGEEDGHLRQQLEEWAAEEAKSVEPAGRTELLVLRAFQSHLDTGEPFIAMVAGCHVRLPDREGVEASVRQFTGVDHIGSGADVAEYAAAVARAQDETIGLVNFYVTMAQRTGEYHETAIARMVAISWANIIARTPTSGVSPDLDVCVISEGPAQGEE